MFTLHKIEQSDLEKTWQELEPLINKWLDEKGDVSEYLLTDVGMYLHTGEWVAWLVRENTSPIGLAVSCLSVFPQCNICYIVGVAGSRIKEWKHFIMDIKQYAKDNRCSKLRGLGRIGWEREMQEMGFKKVYSVIDMEV